MLFNLMTLSSVEPTEEIIEDVLQYTTDDIYKMLSECSNKLSSIIVKMDELNETCSELMQLLENSFIDSVAALLFILVCFETMKLVRGWTKGVIFHGRNR